MKYSTLLKLTAAACIALPGAAFAQASETTDNSAEYEPTEIVVTARKQAEKLSDVPLAITAFDASRIEKEGIVDLNDVARQTPGLNFTSVVGEFMPTPIIRGVAQTDLFGSDPNVAIFVDGVYTGAREALNFAQADIERIEVVKGPQSALYGRNAFAGAINIVSKRPTNDFSGRAELIYGTHGRFGVVGSLSVPLVKDVLAVKLTGSHSEYGGSHKNILGGPRIGGYNYDTFQGTVRFTPTPGMEIVGGLYYSEDHISPPAASQLAPNCQLSGGVYQTYCGTLPTLAKDELGSHPDAYGQTRKTLRAFLDARFDIGDWQLGWLTGYNDVDLTALTDASRGELATFRYRTKTGGIKTFDTYILRDEGNIKFREYSQEIRLTSPQEEPVRASIGAYFFSGRQTRPNFDGVITAPLPSDFLMTFPVPGPWNSFFDGRVFDKTVRRHTENTSFFGYLEGDITSALTLRGELRYSNERQRTLQDGTHIDKRLSFKTWTPRVSLQYKPDNDLLVYASAARGSKAGGFDLNAPKEQYEPEFNWTYEIGAKKSWLNGRVMLDLNAFYIDWTQIQIPVLDQTQAPPVAVTRNLGDAKSKGFEAQLSVRPTRELSARVGISYIDAKYTHALNSGFAKFPDFAPNGDVSGNRLQAAPKWQLNGSVDYRIPIVDDFAGFIHADASYRGKQYMDATDLTIIPSRTVVNLRTGAENDKLRFEFFVENLFDTRRPSFAFRDVYLNNYVNNVGVVYPPRISVTYLRGREMGIRTSFRF